jgi:ATP-dependent Clp protease adaptor protein ClpS
MPTLAPTKRERASKPGEGSGDRWRVIVLNDDHNTFQGVAFALSSTLPGVSYDQGLVMADRIHNTGQDLVWSGHREAAELYWGRLAGFGLTLAPLER